MLDVKFQVQEAHVEPFAATPLLLFKLLVEQAGSVQMPVHAIALRCQIRIDPTRRHYQAREQERLRDLFSTPDRWSQTLKPMLWTHASLVVPPFSDRILVDLPVPCTYDFNVAGTKYFAGLDTSEVPLAFLFSGTIFYEGENGILQVCQIPWEKETTYQLPVRVWKDMMEMYYPHSAWLCLRKDLFDRLYDYKVLHGLPTWEQTLESLLALNSSTPLDATRSAR